MLNIFTQFFDHLFPTRLCIKQLKDESPENFLRHFSLKTSPGGLSLSDYANPSIQAAITANKFYDYEKASLLLSVLLTNWLQTLPEAKTVLVPIPLSKTRQRKRGYNQVTRILEKTIAKEVSIINFLERVKDNKPQTSLSRKERLANIHGVFAYRPALTQIDFDRLVLVDDVITTGATMRAAYKTLCPYLSKDCEVICVAIAH